MNPAQNPSPKTFEQLDKELTDLVGPAKPQGVPPAPKDNVYTFVFLDDVHTDGDDNGDRYKTLKNLVQGINHLTSYKWPAGSSVAGQSIETPIGAVINGDLTNWGGGYSWDYPIEYGNQLQQFRKLFEPGRTSDSIAFRTFLGLGNHDMDPDAAFPPDFYRNQMWNYIMVYHAGNPLLQTPPIQQVSAIDSGVSCVWPLWQCYSYNYVLELADLVFLQLHRYGGDTHHDREGGLDWVRNQLKRIGRTKKIAVCQHYGWDCFSLGQCGDPPQQWWGPREWDPLLSVLDGYNVIGIFHGHIHSPAPYNYSYPDVPYPIFAPGAALDSRFGICRVAANQMDIAWVLVDSSGALNFTPQPYSSLIFPTKDVSVYYQESHGALIESCWIEDAWRSIDLSDAEHLPPPKGGTPLAGLRVKPTHDPRIYEIGQDGDIHEVSWWQAAWHDRDVTKAANAPPPDASSQLTCVGTDDRADPKVYFVATDSHLHELGWWGAVWHDTDLTSAAKAPLPRPEGPLTSMVTGAENKPIVYYLDQEQHVCELGWWGGEWHASDLTAIATSPPADPASGLTCVGTSGSLEPKVYFVATDFHIHELGWWGGAWHDTDLTTTAKASLPLLESPLAAMATGGANDPKLYYLDRGFHVCELGWWGGAWHSTDLTALVAAPAASNRSRLACIGTGDENDPKVYFETMDGDLNELGWWGGQWHRTDLTEVSNGPSPAPETAMAALDEGK